MRHEVAHGIAFLRSSVPQILIREAADGRHWECVPVDNEKRAHADAWNRSTVAGCMVGTPSASDLEDLAAIGPDALSDLKAWCIKNVLPTVAEIDAFELCEMIQTMKNTGGIVMRGPDVH
jgi:hypothetical protein